MNICGGRLHDEIVFDSKACPLCEALERIDELERDMYELSKVVLQAEKENENG